MTDPNISELKSKTCFFTMKMRKRTILSKRSNIKSNFDSLDYEEGRSKNKNEKC